MAISLVTAGFFRQYLVGKFRCVATLRLVYGAHLGLDITFSYDPLRMMRRQRFCDSSDSLSIQPDLQAMGTNASRMEIEKPRSASTTRR